MSHENSRRDFMRQAVWVFSTVSVSTAFLGALPGCTRTREPENGAGVKDPKNSLPPGELPAKEEDPAASALGYKMNALNVDPEKFPKRKGTDGEKQFCKNCQFYTAKNDYWGSCQIIRNGLVSSQGWCNTWSLKPGAAL